MKQTSNKIETMGMFGHKGTMLSSVVDSKSNTIIPSKTRTLNNSKLMRFDDIMHQNQYAPKTVLESLKKPSKKYDDAPRQIVKDKPELLPAEFSTLDGDLNRLYRPRDSSGKPKLRTAHKSLQPDPFTTFNKQTYQEQLKRNQQLFREAQQEIADFHRRSSQIKRRLDNCLNGLTIRIWIIL